MATDPPLEVLYQDAHIVAINKPSGLLVHRSPIDRHETRFAVQLLRDQLGQRVHPLHRLDKPTSGVLLFGFAADTAKSFAMSLAERKVHKTYLAVVRGYCPASGIVDHALREDPDDLLKRSVPSVAKEALTHFRCLSTVEINAAIETYPTSRYSLVELQPITGRRHQLRRHMKHISHPIIGDAKHGRGRHNRYFADQLACHRLLLHASCLRFPHPVSGEQLTLSARFDQQFWQLLQRFQWQDAVPAVSAPWDASLC